MTTTTTVKSTQITNMDASPVVRTTKGEYAPWTPKQQDGYALTVDANGVNSRYILARVPSYVIVKGLYERHGAMGGGTLAFGLCWPDDARYTSKTLSGTIDIDFFKASVAVTAAVVVEADITSGNVLAGLGLAKLFQPLWLAAGESVDPGGYIDIVASPATEITTGAALYTRLVYVQ